MTAELIGVSSIDRLLGLREGVYRAVSPSGTASLYAWPHQIQLGPAGAQVDLAVRYLARHQATAEELHRSFGLTAEELDLLSGRGWLTHTIRDRGIPAITRDPGGGPIGFTAADRPVSVGAGPPPAGTRTMSRFAALESQRGADGERSMVLTTPASACRFGIHDDRVAAWLCRSTWPALAEAPGDQELLDVVTRELLGAGFLVESGAEDGSLASRQWSRHELTFHRRSRLGDRGYLGQGFGGTYWARGSFEPLPARPQPREDVIVVDLPTPDLAELCKTDVPLSAVLEERRSIRNHDDEHPISIGQLGELLYRTCRTRGVRELDGVEYQSRPYPAGGSAYELEIYPLIRVADGIEPALYHYDSHGHRLERVADLELVAVQRLLQIAHHSTAAWARPQVLLLVTARFGRVMWKYEAMAYALTLKHVGVLYQTLYMVASSMGLAACALGSGDSDGVSAALGVDPLAEGAVGEFALGAPAMEVPGD